MTTYDEAVGINSNGDASVTITFKDDKQKPIDYTEISASDSNNVYSKQVLVGTEGASGSLTVYRSGKTVLLKAINYDLKINGPASFYKDTSITQMDAKYRPPINWYSYQACIAYANWTDANLANSTGEALNSSLKDQLCYPVSILIDTNGYVNGKLHRYGWTQEGKSVLVNFELVWLIE